MYYRCFHHCLDSVGFSVCVNQLKWRNNWFTARGIQMKPLTIAWGVKYDRMPFPMQSENWLHLHRNSSTRNVNDIANLRYAVNWAYLWKHHLERRKRWNLIIFFLCLKCLRLSSNLFFFEKFHFHLNKHKMLLWKISTLKWHSSSQRDKRWLIDEHWPFHSIEH